MNDDVAVIAIVSLAIVMCLALAVASALVIRDTVRGRGNWGVNLRAVHCPSCGEPAPVVRRPKNLREALWGGCTCPRCGAEYDKWGRPVPASPQ